MPGGAGATLRAAVAAVLVAGCSVGAAPTSAPSVTAGASSGTPAASVNATISSGSPAATAGASVSGQPILPTPPPNADLYGSITYTNTTTLKSEPDVQKFLEVASTLATVNVALVLDPTAEGGNYVDAGSTFTIVASIHQEKEIGLPPCTGLADWTSDPSLASLTAFSAPVAPDDPGSEISALVSRPLNTFILSVDIYYSLTTIQNACMTGIGPVTETHYAGGPLGCGMLGLVGRLVDNPAGPDQVDMTCVLGDSDTGATVSGTLTIRD
jgi:hypothetical protein